MKEYYLEENIIDQFEPEYYQEQKGKQKSLFIPGGRLLFLKVPYISLPPLRYDFKKA
jgi:hypothetical protein